MRPAHASLAGATKLASNAPAKGPAMSLDPTSTVDLKRMRAVVEVARAQSVTAAAELLGLTQSAVSRAVAEVEEALRVQLFARLPRGLAPTAAGLEFVARARLVLAGVDDLIAGVRPGEALIAGRLRVGVISAGGNAAWAFSTFARRFPEASLEAISGSPQSLCPRLLRGELDLIVGTSAYLSRWRELEVERLAPLHFACLFRKDHPLASLAGAGELDVLRYPVILPETIEPAYSDLAMRCAELRLPAPRPRYVTDDFELACRLVRASDAFYPLMHVRPSFGGLDARFLLLRDAIRLPPHQLSVARAAQRAPSALAEAFCALLASRYLAPSVAAAS